MSFKLFLEKGSHGITTRKYAFFGLWLPSACCLRFISLVATSEYRIITGSNVAVAPTRGTRYTGMSLTVLPAKLGRTIVTTDTIMKA